MKSNVYCPHCGIYMHTTVGDVTDVSSLISKVSRHRKSDEYLGLQSLGNPDIV